MQPPRKSRCGLLLVVLASAVALGAQTIANDYNTLGARDRQKGDFVDKAIADFTKAIELDPQSAAAYNSRGALKRVKGDLKGAIADIAKAIALKPDFAGAYNNRGLAKRIDGDLDGAIADFTRAIALDPKHLLGAGNLAFTREMKENLKMKKVKRYSADELEDMSASENQRLVNAGEPNDASLRGRNPRYP